MSRPPDQPGPPPAPGRAFGPYLVERRLGTGAMGAVLLATDPRLGRKVALKVLLGQHAREETYLRRFRREASVMASLDSPHVVRVYDHGVIDGWPFLACQFAPGGDLGTLLAQRGPLPPGLAARVCSQVADALATAHAVGVVHRDVKAANVLVRDADPAQVDRIHVYLGDFGVAHTESTGLTTAGAVAGTWNYLAPERAEGSPGTPLTDVYSVGCLFWEVLTGRPPYAGSDVEVAMAHLHEPVPQLPGDDAATQRLNAVLARALAKDPAHRPPSALALREELRALVPPAVAPSFSGGPALGARRRRRWLAAGAAAVVLVGGGVAAGAVLTRGGSPEPEPEGPPPSSEPTTAPTPAPEPEPVAPGVTGDLTGDGLGDLVVQDVGRESTQLWASTPSGLAGPSDLPYEFGDLLLGDVTGDGRTDVVRVGRGQRITPASVTSEGADVVTTPLETRPGSAASDEVRLLGDVDGDGHDDLVLGTVDGARVQLLVARGSAEGRFSPSRPWFDDVVGDLDTTPVLAVGDVDGDGRADVVVGTVLAGRPAVLPLLAGDGELVTGEPTPVRAMDESGSLLTADVDGDDVAEVLFLPSFSFDSRLQVLRLDPAAGSFAALPGWGTLEDVEQATVLDADGDGLDDLVLLLFGSDGAEARLVLSNGAGFDSGTAVAGVPRQGSPELRGAGSISRWFGP